MNRLKTMLMWVLVDWAFLSMVALVGVGLVVHQPWGQTNNVAMIGDSLTFSGEWQTTFRDRVVMNFGRMGDTSRGLLRRIGDIERHHPVVGFVLIGTNDILIGIPLYKIQRNYIRIINQMQIRNIAPVIQSIPYTRFRRYNQAIHDMNNWLYVFADTNGIRFVDLNSKLARGRYLNRKYSSDGIHLKPSAYRVWGRMLQPVIAQYRTLTLDSLIGGKF